MILQSSVPEIKLCTYENRDALSLAAVGNNYKIWLNLRDVFPHPYSVADAEYFIEMCSNQDPKTIFGIFYQDNLVGSIGLHLQNDIYSHSAELGYFIGEPYWNKGIANAAIARMLIYGWEILNLKRIYASVFAHNTPSMKVLEKNGFIKEGIKSNAVLKNNELIDEHIFGILSPFIH